MCSQQLMKIEVKARTIAAAAAMAAAAALITAPSAMAAETPGQVAGDDIRSGVTQLEQPIVPYLESVFGYPPVFITPGNPPPPDVSNSTISLLMGGTTGPLLSTYSVDSLAWTWGLPFPAYAIFTPEQLFPTTPQLGSLSLDQSVAMGAADLNTDILAELANHNKIVVWSTSQSSTVSTVALGLLNQEGNPGVGNVSFLLTGDPNNPNGGPFERFTGLYVPILGITFNGATPPNTPYQVTVVSNQYDGVADFPQYPLNVVADLNALAGFAWGQHDYGFPRQYFQLPTSPGYTGNTTYWMSLDPTVPILDPLRDLPQPYGNALADLLQPDTRVIVDLGYGSGEYANMPTPASLVQIPNLATVVPDLVNGTIQGPTQALIDLGLLAPSATTASLLSTYPNVPVLDPNLNLPIPQTSTTGLSLLTTAEGDVHTVTNQAAQVITNAVTDPPATPTPAAVIPPAGTNHPITTAINSVVKPITTAVNTAIGHTVKPLTNTTTVKTNTATTVKTSTATTVKPAAGHGKKH